MTFDERVELGIARGATVGEEQRALALVFAMEYPKSLPEEEARETLARWNADIWAPSLAWRYPWPLCLFVFWASFHFGPGQARRLIPSSGDPYCYLARVMYMASTYSSWRANSASLVRKWSELLANVGECDGINGV